MKNTLLHSPGKWNRPEHNIVKEHNEELRGVHKYKMDEIVITEKEIDELYQKLLNDAKLSGYNLNPDIGFTKDLVKGLLINQKRYGYMCCPCRLSSGIKEKDYDIVCPCDYRDADINEYGACYCGLYISSEILNDMSKLSSIPERRGKINKKQTASVQLSGLSYPVWRCKVCGYLCARENPPEICPICKVKKERFEKFI